jgi:hypothetical protein
MRRMTIIVGLVAGGLLGQACGGGLSYKVSEESLQTLSAEQRVKADLAREAVATAKRQLDESSALVKAGAATVDKAKERVDKADKAAKEAQAKIDATDAALKAKLKDADKTKDAAVDKAEAQEKAAVTAAKAEHAASPNEERMDQSIKSAESIRDADVGVAKANYSKAEAVAKADHAKAQDTNRAVLADKKSALQLEQARLRYAEAGQAELKARHEVREAAWWVAQAQYEQNKFDAVTEAAGATETPDAQKKRLKFEGQVADKEAVEREAAEELLEREADTAAAKKALDVLAPPPPAPVVEPAPAP